MRRRAAALMLRGDKKESDATNPLESILQAAPSESHLPRSRTEHCIHTLNAWLDASGSLFPAVEVARRLALVLFLLCLVFVFMPAGLVLTMRLYPYDEFPPKSNPAQFFGPIACVICPSLVSIGGFYLSVRSDAWSTMVPRTVASLAGLLGICQVTILRMSPTVTLVDAQLDWLVPRVAIFVVACVSLVELAVPGAPHLRVDVALKFFADVLIGASTSLTPVVLNQRIHREHPRRDYVVGATGLIAGVAALLLTGQLGCMVICQAHKAPAVQNGELPSKERESGTNPWNLPNEVLDNCFIG